MVDGLNDTEKLLVLSLDDAESKKISQVIANDTARDILDLLADEPLSSTEISERLDIPLTTVQYNIEKLTEAGLIDVKAQRWSKKGRTIKIYGPRRRLLIIVPERIGKEDILGAVKRYIGVLLFAGLISVVLEFIRWGGGANGALESTQAVSEERTLDAVPVAIEKVTTDIWSYGDHIGLYFFAGAVFVVLVNILYERWKK
ncbi:hypothetical protein DRN98_00315 [Methanosarcinales archaeon]|nr:MAG: hypothetical protein DRN98_00315 [Methanosarcinales archaeon]